MRRDLAICVGLLGSILSGLQTVRGEAPASAVLPARLYAFDGVSYVGDVPELTSRDTKADITVEYRIRVISQGGATIPLLPAEAAISDSKVTRGDGHIRRTRTGCELFAAKPGDYAAKITFRVNVHAQAKTYTLDLPLVPHALTTVSLRIPQADIKVVTTPPVPVLLEQPSPGITLATFAPTASGQVWTAELDNSTDGRYAPPIVIRRKMAELNNSADARVSPTLVGNALRGIPSVRVEWFPKAFEKELSALVQLDANSRVYVNPGVLKRREILRYFVPRGEVESFEALLPRNTTLANVTCKALKDWRTEDRGDQKALKVDLKDKVTGLIDLIVDLEQPTAAPPAEFTVEPVTALGVERQSGNIAVIEEGGLTVRDKAATGARKIDFRTLDGAFEGIRDLTKVAFRYDTLPVAVTLAAERTKPRVTAKSETLAEIETGLVTLRSRMDFNIEDAGVYAIRLKLDEDLVPLDLKGNNLSDWDVAGQVVTVRFKTQALGGYRLDVSTQQNMKKIDGIVIPRIETLDTEAESGLIGISVGPGVYLQHYRAAHTRQVDVTELPEWLRRSGAKLGYAYQRKGGSLAVSTLKIEPELGATFYTFLSVESDALKAESTVVCRVDKAGVFAVAMKLPIGFMPTDVVGEGISDWSYDDRAATLRLSFESERRGPFTFRVLAERRVAELAALDLSSIEMVAAKRNDGFLAISPRTNVSLRSTAETRLTPIDPAQLPEVLNAYPDIALAYSFNQPEWRLGLQCTAVEPVIEAQTLSLVKFRQGQATVETDIRYQILKAGVNSLQVELPPHAGNSSVLGEGIHSKELKANVWTILLDEKKKGDYALRVCYEAALDPKADTFNYTGVILPGVNRQTGYILLAQERPDAEVAVTEAMNAQPMDERELPPQFAAKRDLPVLQCYRYSAPDRRVACRVLGRELSEAMLQASAPSCEIQTVIKHTGEAVSYLRCDLRNTRKQFLKVKLGDRANFWGAYVDGIPVRTSLTQDGSHLIPIAEPTLAASMFPVEVVWAESIPRLGITGSLPLDTPELDVKVEKMSWRVHVPIQYKLRAVAGNLRLFPYEDKPVNLVELCHWALYTSAKAIAQRAWQWAFMIGFVVFVAACVALLAYRKLGLVSGTVLALLALCWALVLFMPSRREEARKSICYSNLKQIGLALNMYSNDYDEFYPTRAAQLAQQYKVIARPTDGLEASKFVSVAQQVVESLGVREAGERDVLKAAKRVEMAAEQSQKASADEALRQAAQERIQAGQQLAQRGDVQKAIQEFEKSLQIDPSRDNRARVAQARRSAGMHWFNLGASNAYQGVFTEATRDLKNALALDPALKEAKDALKQAEAQQHIEQQVQVAQKAEMAKVPAEAAPPAAQPQALDAVTQALDQRLAQRKAVEARRMGEQAGIGAGGLSLGRRSGTVSKLRADDGAGALERLKNVASRGVEALERGRYDEAKESLEEVLASKVDLGPTANRALREHLAKAERELDRQKDKGKEDQDKAPKGVLTTPGVAITADKPAEQRTLCSLSLLFDQYISARKAHEAPRREYEVRDKLVTLEEFPRKGAALGADRKRVEKGRHWFRPETASDGLARVSGGKAAGVLPIALQFPATGTVGYYFERPYAGGLRGEIRLECIRIGAALCLQGALAFFIIVALAAGYRRRPATALVLGLVLVVVLGFLNTLATEAAREYFIVAIWAAGLSTAVLALLMAGRRMRLAAE